MGLSARSQFFFLYVIGGSCKSKWGGPSNGSFERNAGSAAALLGFLQMAIGAIASVFVGVLKAQQVLPIAIILASAGILALITLLIGRRKIENKIAVSADSAAAITH